MSHNLVTQLKLHDVAFGVKVVMLYFRLSHFIILGIKMPLCFYLYAKMIIGRYAFSLFLFYFVLFFSED